MLTFFLLFVFLIGLFCLTAQRSAWQNLLFSEIKTNLLEAKRSFFYLPIHRLFFPQHHLEGVFFANICAQSFYRFLYVYFCIAMIFHLPEGGLIPDWSHRLGFLAIAFFVFFIFVDYLPRIIGARYPLYVIRFASFISSFFMLSVFPLTFIFIKLSQIISRPLFPDNLSLPVKEEIIEMIRGVNMSENLDPHDKKLMESVVRFKDRITREVMVPRVDLFSLPADMTIQEASKALLNEGYSRVPIYKDSNDNMIGIIMYKDVIAKYMDYVEQNNNLSILQAPISTLMKSVIYTPETKKISHLLQEFRKKQVHLAIVVDEYGGTEGIITIEDILEEIVGDIADEYDEAATALTLLPEGGWVIDARANIFDIEEELNVKIPHSGDYETIGGYIFHETGMVPPKGFILKTNDYEIEVLSSDDRRVGKVRFNKISSPITPS